MPSARHSEPPRATCPPLCSARSPAPGACGSLRPAPPPRAACRAARRRTLVLATSPCLAFLPGRVEHPGDGLGQPLPLRGLRHELLPPVGRQAVVLRAAVVLGRAPLGGNPAAALEALEGRV